MNQLIQLLNGRKIAIVGNGTPAKDYSSEIDSADVVVRFNHFYNYESDKVGKRIDIILQTIAGPWFTAAKEGKAHLELIKDIHPHIFLVKRPEHYTTDIFALYGNNIRVNNLTHLFEPWYKYTTGTAALSYLAANLTNAEVKCYGFSNEGDEAPYNEYLAGEAKHYSQVKDDERAACLKAIETLENLTITEKGNGYIPKAIVVPVKAISTGAPNKNRFLLRGCLEKLQSLDYPIYVTGDDTELLHSVKDLCTTVPLTAIPALDDVTKTLRRWQVETGFSGEIALVQCTSPYLNADWVNKCFDELKYSAITATAVELKFKPTSMFYSVNGVFVPLAANLPSASVARQLLPPAMRITGAVECFHTDALIKDSFFEFGCVRPVYVTEDESLDVDTKEDLDKAFENIIGKKQDDNENESKVETNDEEPIDF